jgi:hypothetical protein
MTTTMCSHHWNMGKAGRWQVLLLLTVLSLQNVFAQEFKKNGTVGFTFLEVPATARTAALGEASIALSTGDASSIFDNPAALGFSRRTHSFSASYAPWFTDIKNYASSYAIKTGIGLFGVGFVMFDYGSFPRTIVGDGQKVYEVIGNFDASAMSLGLTYSTMLTDRFSFGATVKYVREKIDVYSASNMLLDGGVLYFTGLGTFRIAAVVQNFGVNSKFINDEFKMPAVFKLGVAVEVWGEPESENRMTLLVSALHPNDAGEKVVVGGEYAWMNLLMLRAGYKFLYDEESYSLGVGLRAPVDLPVVFDFAYSDYGRLGRISRLTLQIGLD